MHQQPCVIASLCEQHSAGSVVLYHWVLARRLHVTNLVQLPTVNAYFTHKWRNRNPLIVLVYRLLTHELSWVVMSHHGSSWLWVIVGHFLDCHTACHHLKQTVIQSFMNIWGSLHLWTADDLWIFSLLVVGRFIHLQFVILLIICSQKQGVECLGQVCHLINYVVWVFRILTSISVKFHWQQGTTL